jgi:Ca2+-binding RTX toxin-like protein
MMLDNFIGAWMRRAVERRSSGQSRPRSRPLQPRLDVLEGRELLDGGIALVAGTITIQASAPVNTAEVSYTDPSHATIAVVWNSTVVDYSSSAVTGISFDGTGSVNEFENLTSISSTAIGGDGTNIFVGGSGNDTFIGGNGFNLFWVAGGNDTLVGGTGENIFLGVSGNDTTTVGNGSLSIIIP